MLSGIKEINGDAEHCTGEKHPPATKHQIMGIAKRQNRSNMATELQKTKQV